MVKNLENATVRIYMAKNNFIYGKITACDKTEWKNVLVLKKLSYDAEEAVWKGEIYSPDYEMTISCTAKLINNDKLEVVGSKYFFSKTYYWYRKI